MTNNKEDNNLPSVVCGNLLEQTKWLDQDLEHQ